MGGSTRAMREIKFRVWAHDKMHYHVFFKRTVQGNNLWFAVNVDRAIALEDASVMQFTGLLDKCGKEVYEGDILKAWHGAFWNGETEKEENSGVGVVSWQAKELRYRVDIPKGHWWPTPEVDGWTRFEVLGNIYENPELLDDTVVVSERIGDVVLKSDEEVDLSEVH